MPGPVPSAIRTPSLAVTLKSVELRAGYFDGKRFIEHPGGSLIQERAIDAAIQEYLLDGYDVRTFRMSPSLLGAGFIEAIPSQTLADIASHQPSLSDGRIAGQLIKVPVLEADNALRAGRFGWKNQHASLISFAADAYLNEMGITSPLQPTENTSIGRSVEAFDEVPDPEDEGEDIEIFASFMRATKAPPRDAELAVTPDAQAGEQPLSANRLRDLSRPNHHHGPGRHRHQRWSIYGAGGPWQQNHPPVQRLPAA